MVAGIVDGLKWLGLDWDEGPDVGGPHAPYRQSERADAYEAALARLAADGRLYRCDCSRAEIARVASAPHAGDEGPRYPGTCRPFGVRERTWKRPPAIRLAVPDGVVHVDDALQGAVDEDVAARVGDFVLKRGDGLYAYQLACVVDDLAMGVTEVVRGADLLDSTARQVLLARLLAGTPPAFVHVPLVVEPDGARLAKRAAGVTIRDHRERGRSPRELVRMLAEMLGLSPADTPRAMLDGFRRESLAGRREVRVPVGWLRP